jgi:replicative DNA helicase
MCSDITSIHGVFDPMHKINEHAYVAEQCFLSAFLQNHSAHNNPEIKAYLLLVEEYHFVGFNHDIIYRALRKCYDAEKPLNLFTAKEYFPEGVAGKEILKFACEFLEFAISPYNAPEYAESIKRYWAERLRINILQDAMAGKISFDEANLTIADIFSTIEEKDMQEPQSVFDGMVSIFNELENNSAPKGIKTKIPELNEVLGTGLQRGGLYIVAGRPAMGKSAFATSVFLPAIGSDDAVLFFSLEMTSRELNARVLSEFANDRGLIVSYKDILSGNINHYVQKSIMDNIGCVRDIPFIIDDNSHQTIESIKQRIEEYIKIYSHKGKTLSTVVVDHIGLITPNNRYAGNKVNEIGEITRALKSMAKDFDIAVVALCQLNRGVEKQIEKRPQLADLRGSGDIEQDANVVIALYRDAYYNADKGAYEGTLNEIEAIILKNRSGECKTVKMYCDLPFNVIRGM